MQADEAMRAGVGDAHAVCRVLSVILLMNYPMVQPEPEQEKIPQTP